MSQAVVFDVGRVLFQWQLGALFEKLIADRDELDWFLANVVTEEWHFEHDRGRALADMVPERIALFPQYEAHIRAYAMRFNETVPGPVEGTHAIVERLAGKGVPLFCLTNFGDEFWDMFRSTQPVFDHFADIIVSGVEKVAKPDPRIYAMMCERLGVPPQACIYLDDLGINCKPAAAMGMHAIKVTSGEQALADLSAVLGLPLGQGSI